MGSALLSEPFLLANYPIPSQNFPRSVETSKGKGNRYVKVSGSCNELGEGFATVTVQGDGVHILEVQFAFYILTEYAKLNAAFEHARDSVTHFRALRFLYSLFSYTAHELGC
jgi:hypothetical protein